MILCDLVWDEMPYEWDATERVAEACFPQRGKNSEQFRTLELARDAVRIFALVAMQHHCSNLGYIRELALLEDRRQGFGVTCSDVSDVPLALKALKAVSRVRGSLFCEPLKFLTLNLNDSNAEKISRRWNSITHLSVIRCL